MDYYLFAARSVTHAQRMARLLSDAGISAKIRRAGAAITERGCGYTLEIPRRHAARAMQACRAGGVLPVKMLFVSDDGMQEVALCRAGDAHDEFARARRVCRGAAGRRAAVSLPQRSRGALLRAVERAGRFHDERDAWTEHRHQEPCPPVRAGRRLRL